MPIRDFQSISSRSSGWLAPAAYERRLVTAGLLPQTGGRHRHATAGIASNICSTEKRFFTALCECLHPSRYRQPVATPSCPRRGAARPRCRGRRGGHPLSLKLL